MKLAKFVIKYMMILNFTNMIKFHVVDQVK